MTTTDVTVRYTDARGFGSNSLRYFTKNGRHYVAHYMNAGEQDFPEVYSFDTIEAARAMWRKLVAHLAKCGYTEKVP